MRQIHIGTSGWHYAHWRGSFYPRTLRSDDYLAHYAAHFRDVEINQSFYRLPSPSSLEAWREATPADFRFAIKASRYITHMKKLAVGPEAGFTPFFSRIEALGPKLGPILFQLPPRWRFDGERLRRFLKALPADFRYVFELRDPSWLNEYAYGLLADHQAAFCIYELNGFRTRPIVTADFVYVRLHGPAGPYQGAYGEAGLAPWAEACRTWLSEGREVYVFFDNDQAACAPFDAMGLERLLAASPGEVAIAPALNRMA